MKPKQIKKCSKKPTQSRFCQQSLKRCIVQVTNVEMFGAQNPTINWQRFAAERSKGSVPDGKKRKE